MGITKDRGRYYWVKRIPKRFAGLVSGADGKPVKQVRQALHTDSRAEAEVKAAQIEAARMAEWEALAAGDGASARRHYEAARKLAQARGFPYTPMPTLAEGDLGDLVHRVLSLSQGGVLASPAATEAVLGAVPEALPTLTEMRDEYYDLTKTRHLKKSEAQLEKWRQKRDRAVRNFINVIVPGPDTTEKDMPLADATRENALKFRAWWQAKVEGGLKIDTANKDFAHLSEMVRTWAKLTETPFPDPFGDLRLDGKDDEAEKPAFSPSWVRDKILAPGALDGLNDEAADILLVMINTGARPSEITDAPADDFQTTANIPFLRVAPHGRELKVAHTKRDIPLLGVSLEAARRIKARGGIQRYAHKANSWSAAVNKFLKEHELRETPRHTAYSVRHYVENALLAAKVDDRVRADILGHKYDRPKYGDGGALAGRREALELIAA